MLGKIKEIREVRNIQGIASWQKMDGYKIETEKHIFHVLIENGQQCCEDWGYITSDDDLEYYIGSELLEVDTIDTELNQKIITEIEEDFDDISMNDIEFVDFRTSIGVFQLAVYNLHNGFYGHQIMIKKDGEILTKGWL